MRNRMRAGIAFAATCTLLNLGSAALAQQAATLTPEQIDQVVETARASFQIPGVAIAVIQPGQPTYVKGYGLVDQDAPTAVDAQTLFGIGSITKAFTITAIAMLAQDGLLDWDDPVIKHIPEFLLADPWVTREFTIRDLVTHRSGLPDFAGDLIIMTEGKANKAQVYHALANIPAVTSFRTTFAYDNLLYIVAGDLIERVSGQSWQDFIQTRILTPLGMDGCVPDQLRLDADSPLAIAHDYADGVLTNVNFPMPQITVPAGGIFCSAEGMARWIEFNLDPSTKLGLDSDRLDELFAPVVPLPVNAYANQYGAGTTFSAYSMGWVVQGNFGRREAQHGGGIPGMVSTISIYPDSGFGVIVMTNKSTDAGRVVTLQLANLAFSAEPVDIIAAQGEAEIQAITEAQAAAAVAGASPIGGNRPALPLESYVGRYDDAWFGATEIRLEDGHLVMDLGSAALTGPLRHVDGDLFVASWSDRTLNANAYVNFRQDPQGQILGIAMSAVSEQADPSFNFQDLDLVRHVALP